jgi:hypothetical protein
MVIYARNEIGERAYYRCEDGGVTWACMELPTLDLR